MSTENRDAFIAAVVKRVPRLKTHELEREDEACRATGQCLHATVAHVVAYAYTVGVAVGRAE